MPKGRTRINGSGRKPANHCRTAVCNYKKLEVINWHAKFGLESTLKRFFSHIADGKLRASANQVYRWRNSRTAIAEACGYIEKSTSTVVVREPCLLRADGEDDVVQLLVESGILDTEVGIIDSDDDFDQ
ncbi:unnamed protein product [Phytophthora fragariaefolia]|uniref:Unnamed protein product n=1 Tax=Phytophthora fragariaefolia TaxID=1490495 RepID=A0A9W6XQU1_9STRA|nr:unnamed protein product [Phytophthora fragariaefolia]